MTSQKTKKKEIHFLKNRSTCWPSKRMTIINQSIITPMNYQNKNQINFLPTKFNHIKGFFHSLCCHLWRKNLPHSMEPINHYNSVFFKRMGSAIYIKCFYTFIMISSCLRSSFLGAFSFTTEKSPKQKFSFSKIDAENILIFFHHSWEIGLFISYFLAG